MVNFDNFGGQTSVLKFHIFLILNCEELVRIRAICEGQARFFSDVKNWYSIFTNVKNWYQFLTPVKNLYSISINVKNQYQMLTYVKNWYQFFTDVKNWYQIFTDVKNWYLIFTLYGVPQGSILGPLLFLIFINDLPLFIGDSIQSVDLYADDTTLYDIGLDKDMVENNLQHSLNLLKMWCLENGMIINIDKTKLMLISSRQKKKCMKDNKLAIEYDNFDLQLTSCEKVLGVHIDDNLTWTNHFQHVSKKISSYLWLLFQIKSYLSLQHRVLFYNAYIKPHFEYCCVIWGNSFNSNLHKIEKLQRRACKLILGTDYISLEDARRQLNMLSFEELVFVNKAKVMFKVTQGISPIYIAEMFQIKGCNNEDTMTLRSDSNKNFKTPKPKLNMSKNSLSYSGTLIWNSIPLEIRNANTIGDFVKKCITWMKDL